MLNVPMESIWRPRDGENMISFVAPLAGPNYLTFTMNWTKTEDNRFLPYVCPRYFGNGCPICQQGKRTGDPVLRREYMPKNRILLNIWDMKREPVPKLWDVSQWLLRRALPGEEIGNPKLWDPSKYGELIDLYSKRAPAGWPEYQSSVRPRNVDIPRAIRSAAYDLRGILVKASVVPEGYGTEFLKTKEVEKLTIKDKVAQIVGEKKPAYERKVKRKIILD
jgi:hypothetical protein